MGMGKRIEFALGILNGAVGDHLARTQNGLAIELCLVHGGEPLAPTAAALAAAYPHATGKLVLFAHGLMCNESIWTLEDGSDYGSRLRDALGFTPLYLRYNSGLAIADNGAALAHLLEQVVAHWPVPVEELVLVGYSMGGLVVRSACHTAALSGGAWLQKVQRALYVGTPHQGAPMERGGRVLTRLLRRIPDPITRLVGEIADLRSDGVKDLGDADLRHEDRARREVRLSLRDPRHPVPLLPGIEHFLLAGAVSPSPWLQALLGDTVVPVASATFREPAEPLFKPEHVKVLPGLTHVALAHHPAVYTQLHEWLSERP
jgi:pimeloyl-ACP methyl ester carboxylesterase